MVLIHLSSFMLSLMTPLTLIRAMLSSLGAPLSSDATAQTQTKTIRARAQHSQKTKGWRLRKGGLKSDFQTCSGIWATGQPVQPCG